METNKSFLGMSEKDVQKYSITRLCQRALKHEQPDGLEKEMSDEATRRNGGTIPNGLFVPFDVIGRRDLTVGNFNTGGAFVQGTVFPEPIPLLRNRLVARRLGCTVLDGLQGNCLIPRQTGAATAETPGEVGLMNGSTAAIDQIALTPKRIGATTKYSKQLLLQSSIAVENFVRDDLFKVIAAKWDKVILEGQGGGEPTGLIATPGVGNVTFGGAATWAKALEFENALATNNADVDGGKFAFVTTPNVRTKWKAIPKITASTFPIFLWEKGTWTDGTNDGEVNSYRSAVTNQVSGSLVYFGNWQEVVLGIWGVAVDLVIDPYTLADKGEVKLTGNSYIDTAVRHPQSFTISTDSGAQ